MSEANTDTFGTFLEVMQGKRGAREVSAESAVLLVLSVLAKRGQLDSDDLWQQSGLDIPTFARALKAARDGGFVAAGEEPGDSLALTPSGARIAAQS